MGYKGFLAHDNAMSSTSGASDFRHAMSHAALLALSLPMQPADAAYSSYLDVLLHSREHRFFFVESLSSNQSHCVCSQRQTRDTGTQWRGGKAHTRGFLCSLCSGKFPFLRPCWLIDPSRSSSSMFPLTDCAKAPGRLVLTLDAMAAEFASAPNGMDQHGEQPEASCADGAPLLESGSKGLR